jgi:hypothetical protein
MPENDKNSFLPPSRQENDWFPLVIIAPIVSGAVPGVNGNVQGWVRRLGWCN